MRDNKRPNQNTGRSANRSSREDDNRSKPGKPYPKKEYPKEDRFKKDGETGSRGRFDRKDENFSKSDKPYIKQADAKDNRFRKDGDKDFSKDKYTRKDSSFSKSDKPYGRAAANSDNRYKKDGDKDFPKDKYARKDSSFAKADKPYGRPKDSRDNRFKKDNDEDFSKDKFAGKEDGRNKRAYGKEKDERYNQRAARPPRGKSSEFRKDKFEDGGSSYAKGKKFDKRKPEDSQRNAKPAQTGKGKPYTKPAAIPQYDFKKLKDIAEKKGETLNPTGDIRLNKYIANAGVCSRRDADVLIQEGQIKVNGEVITEMGHKVKNTDKVSFNNKLLSREKMVYVLLNKPKDFITTTEDPENRKTVMQLIANACEERIYPVGRLDRNTTGLLLFTNDGELTKKLSHPSHGVKKLYEVALDKPITDEDFIKIQEGVTLEDGLAPVDELAIVDGDRRLLGIQIHIGKNRIVRRIFEHLGYTVERLDRVMYAGLDKKDVPRGHWRYLAEKEVIQLKFFI